MTQGYNILYNRIILMGNCIKKIFPLNKKISNSYEELNEKKIKNNFECIICFHYLEDDEISLPCMINNCTINAHQRCIKEWYQRKKCCPICNEELIKIPSKPFSITRLLSY